MMLAVNWVLLIVPSQEGRQLMHGSDTHTNMQCRQLITTNSWFVQQTATLTVVGTYARVPQ
jgi:hypothetical protein